MVTISNYEIFFCICIGAVFMSMIFLMRPFYIYLALVSETFNHPKNFISLLIKKYIRATKFKSDNLTQLSAAQDPWSILHP